MNTLLSQITIRPGDAADQLALRRLAALDSAPVPAQPLLVAELDGELSAALSLHDGTSIADPFRPTAQIVALLRAHAAAATQAPRTRRRASQPRLSLARG
ncbi:MAG TPA: hypothetical protein VNV17_12695 [Solirubrobacteraceae bacterium]|nr:hypothetical protein [Solirubrobacteraceae bacterium]